MLSAAVKSEKANARSRLWAWADAPLTLTRSVYFVPGLSDERGQSCWGRVDEGEICFRTTMGPVCTNATARAWFVEFTAGPNTSAPPAYENFLRFGADLARMIQRDVAGTGEKVDLVCHSMGGLDALTAIALLDDYRGEFGVEPLRCVENVITFDTPFRGFAAADNEIFVRIKKLQRPDEPTIVSQAAALKPDSLRIQEVWLNRDRFLRNVGAFHPRGADNYAGLLEVPHDSASFGGRSDFAPEWRDRYRDYLAWEGTTHSGSLGVTRDPRAIVEVLEIITRP